MTEKQGPPAQSAPEPPTGAAETIPPHWHYATAVPGYSPDAETFPSVTDVFDLAAELAQELGEWEDFLSEGMGICADKGDAEELLKEYERFREVEYVRYYLGNIERQRKMAFWADKQGQLSGNVLTYLANNFPLVVTHNSSLEVWPCDAGQECEHWEAEE